MKICLVCSHGGHFTETLQILNAFEGHDIFFATYYSSRQDDVSAIARAYFTTNIGYNIWRMLRACLWSLRVLLHEKPEVIVSLGAEIALPFFYWAKLLRIKTIFIETWCRVEDLSKTGRLVILVADVFLVQWPQLLDACGPKAQFKGAIV